MAEWMRIRNENDFRTFTKGLGNNTLLIRGPDGYHNMIGYVRVDEGRGYFVSNGRVAVAKQYKMLVIKGNSTKFQWYYLREGEYLPPDAFVSGRTYNGSKPVYIGKTTVDGEVLYGRVRQSSVPVLAVAVTRNRRRVDFAYSFYVLVQPGVVGF